MTLARRAPRDWKRTEKPENKKGAETAPFFVIV